MTSILCDFHPAMAETKLYLMLDKIDNEMVNCSDLLKFVKSYVNVQHKNLKKNGVNLCSYKQGFAISLMIEALQRLVMWHTGWATLKCMKYARFCIINKTSWIVLHLSRVSWVNKCQITESMAWVSLNFGNGLGCILWGDGKEDTSNMPQVKLMCCLRYKL